jgi:hypothetical protein
LLNRFNDTGMHRCPFQCHHTANLEIKISERQSPSAMQIHGLASQDVQPCVGQELVSQGTIGSTDQ